jgi:hypothetical protein
MYLNTLLSYLSKNKMNIKFRNYLFLLIAFLPLVLCSCKDEIITPNDPPGRRDYVWSVDTISNIAPGNYYYSITGGSINNLWISGSGEAAELQLLHFNGTQWDAVKKPYFINPSSMYSFGNDSTWFGGEGGKFWCYKNNSYSLINEYPLENYDCITYEDMWTDNGKDVFASGLACALPSPKSMYGIIMEYSDKEWKYIYKPDIKTQFLQIRRCTKTSSNLYLVGVEVEKYTSGIYEYDYKNMKKIFNTDWDHVPYIISINGEVLFYYDSKLHSYLSNSFQTIIDFSAYNITSGHINGRSLNDLFIGTKDGIGHYNGNEVKTLLPLNNSILMNSVLFDDGMALIYRDNTTNKYYVARGKLN